MKKKTIYILIIIIAFFAGVIGSLLVIKHSVPETIKTVKEIEVIEENSLKKSIEKIYDAVFLIETYNGRKQIGSGTGFAYKIDEKYAYILTNHHVIAQADKIVVTNSEGKQLEAKFKGSDEYSDVAVLSLKKEDVKKVANIGKSKNSEVGDTVFTVGSPLGSKYMGTVTKGILSGTNRQITVSVSNGSFMLDVLQTDAAINPGNSGGPLVNINGDVIGITSLKLVEDEVEGMGFALPIEEAISYAESLEKGKAIERPTLGIQFAELENYFLLRSYGIDVQNAEYGIVILKVEEDSAADQGGLQVGDILTEINNEKVTDSATFRYNLYKHKVGDKIKITYMRNSNKKTIEIVLKETY